MIKTPTEIAIKLFENSLSLIRFDEPNIGKSIIDIPMIRRITKPTTNPKVWIFKIE